MQRYNFFGEKTTIQSFKIYNFEFQYRKKLKTSCRIYKKCLRIYKIFRGGIFVASFVVFYSYLCIRFMHRQNMTDAERQLLRTGETNIHTPELGG